ANPNAADRLAVPSTVPEEGRRLLVVGKASGGQQLTAKQKTPQPLEVALVSGARKHLHDDHLRRCQRFAALDQLPQRPVHRSLTSSQVLDPGGRVNQDQRSVTARDARSSSRSASQPDPCRSRASAVVRGSPTRCRSARSTASRFERRPYLRIASATSL